MNAYGAALCRGGASAVSPPPVTLFSSPATDRSVSTCRATHIRSRSVSDTKACSRRASPSRHLTSQGSSRRCGRCCWTGNTTRPLNLPTTNGTRGPAFPGEAGSAERRHFRCIWISPKPPRSRTISAQSTSRRARRRCTGPTSMATGSVRHSLPGRTLLSRSGSPRRRVSRFICGSLCKGPPSGAWSPEWTGAATRESATPRLTGKHSPRHQDPKRQPRRGSKPAKFARTSTSSG